MTKSEQIESLAKKLGYKVVHTTAEEYERSCEREDETFQEAERRLIVVSEQGRCDMKKLKF